MSDLLTALAVGLLVAVLSVVVPALLRRRRRRLLERGDAAAFRVRLAGSAAPYPQTPRRGVLRVGPDTLVWSGRGGGPVLDLAPSGVHALRPRAPRRGDRAGQDDTVVTAADGLGTPLRLVGRQETVEQLVDLLGARPLPSPPAAPRLLQAGAGLRLGLPALLLVLGLAGLGLTAAAVTTGERVTGTTVGEPDRDDYCAVRWTDPRDGRTRTNSLDCYWDVGDRVPLVALAGPLRGAVVDRDDPPLWAGAAGLVALAGLGLGVLRVREGRRDRDAPAPAAAVGPARPPTLTADRLSHAEVEAATRTRAAAEGWSFDVDTAAPPPRLTDRFAAPVGLALAALPLAIALGAGLLAGWSSAGALWATSGPTVEVDAEVRGEPVPTLPLAPDDLEVRFPVEGGGTRTTLVPVRGVPDPAPRTLPVRYDPDEPGRARALEHDAARRGALVGGGAVAVGLLWSGWSTWRVLAVRRLERRALRSPERRRLPYVLVPDLDGESCLLLFESALGPPRHLLLLAGEPVGRVPASGTVEVRGRYAAGEVVAAVLDGRELATATPLLEVDLEELLALVNGEPLAVVE